VSGGEQRQLKLIVFKGGVELFGLEGVNYGMSTSNFAASHFEFIDQDRLERPKRLHTRDATRTGKSLHEVDQRADVIHMGVTDKNQPNVLYLLRSIGSGIQKQPARIPLKVPRSPGFVPPSDRHTKQLQHN
jgi:hypothetical protein